jgi:dolichyl-phosphate beta-glucosyltransferase
MSIVTTSENETSDRAHPALPETASHWSDTGSTVLAFPHRRGGHRGGTHSRVSTRRLDGILDLVIPAYNEERRIGRTVEQLAGIITDRQLPVRLVVVDNGSVDRTASAVDTVAKQIDVDLSVISCATRGKGAAVRAGVAHSTGEYIGFCDADLPVPPDALVWAVDLLASGWDVVVGSRRCAGARYEKEQSIGRRLGSAAYRAASARLRGGVADTQCGFKFFRADIAHQVFDGAQIDGFSFDIEILARTQRIDGVRLIEMPVPWSDQEGSSFRAISDGIRSFSDLRQARRSVRYWAPEGMSA